MLKTELRDSIRILILDRPNKSNSLHPDLIHSLHETGVARVVVHGVPHVVEHVPERNRGP